VKSLKAFSIYFLSIFAGAFGLTAFFSGHIYFTTLQYNWNGYDVNYLHGDTLYQRHLLNLSRIRTRHADPVAAHFYTDGHSVADFRVMGLEKLHGSDDYRRTMEQLWKRKLRTYRPYGINTQEWGSARKWREHYVNVVNNWRHIRFNCIVTSWNKYGRWRRPLGRKLRQKYKK